MADIGANAFRNTGLAAIHLPKSVASIGEHAFAHCSSLSAIQVATDNSHFASPGGVLFNKDLTELILYPPAKAGGDYSIPSTVTTLGYAAFQGAQNLVTVTIPSGVTALPDYAFSLCTNLVSVSLASGLSHIGDYAFDQCFKLSNLTLPDSVVSIGGQAFLACSSLTHFTVGDGVRSLGEGVFASCTNLTSISLGAGLESVGPDVFKYCPSLVAIQVHAANQIFSSADGVLFNKSRDTLLLYPRGRIGGYTVPGGVTHIGKEAFYECGGLTLLRLPEGLTHLGEAAFVSCPLLTRLTIPASVTHVGAYVFESLTAPADIYMLGDAPLLEALPEWEPYDITIHYFESRSGFTSPTWNGYATASMGAPSEAKQWLLSIALPHDTDLSSDPDADGVPLLTAYGLGLDPHENLAGKLPVAGMENTSPTQTLSISFFSGNADVGYVVETSQDLTTWTTEGVNVSPPDAEQVRIAAVPMTGPRQFLRLSIVH